MAWHGTRAPSSAFPLQNPLYSSSSFALEPRASLLPSSSMHLSLSLCRLLFHFVFRRDADFRPLMKEGRGGGEADAKLIV